MYRTLILCLLAHFAVDSAYAATSTVRVIDKPLNFSLTDGHYPAGNEIFYGKELVPWDEWKTRKEYSALKPSQELLFPKPPMKPRPAMQVFEARFAGVVDKPATYFTESYLHNINTVRRFDANKDDSHVDASDGDQFKVISKIQFPSEWSKVVKFLVKINFLDSTKTDYLEMKSEFTYFDADMIANVKEVNDIVGVLDVTGKTPYALELQNIVEVNEIGYFGSIVTLFYEINDHQTLVVSSFVLGLKTKDLDRGIHFYPYDFTGKAVLFGENPMMRSDGCKGICEGLPEYTKQLFVDTFNGLRH